MKFEIRNNTEKGYLEPYEGNGIYTKDIIQTLTTFQDKGVVVKDERN